MTNAIFSRWQPQAYLDREKGEVREEVGMKRRRKRAKKERSQEGMSRSDSSRLQYVLQASLDG